MTAYIAGSWSLWQLVFLILWLVAVRCAAMQGNDLEVLFGHVVRECLRRAEIPEEVAADRMKMDLSSLRKCLRGEGNLQLGIARLARLGLTFMTYLTPLLLYHVARLHAEQVLDDAKDAVRALVQRKAS